MSEAPDEFPVYIALTYREALRLSYIANIRDDRTVLPEDAGIAEKVNAAIERADPVCRMIDSLEQRLANGREQNKKLRTALSEVRSQVESWKAAYIEAIRVRDVFSEERDEALSLAKELYEAASEYRFGVLPTDEERGLAENLDYALEKMRRTQGKGDTDG